MDRHPGVECIVCGHALDACTEEWTLVCPQCGTARVNPRWEP